MPCPSMNLFINGQNKFGKKISFQINDKVMLASSAVDVGSRPSQVKPKAIKLLFVASAKIYKIIMSPFLFFSSSHTDLFFSKSMS